MINFCDSLIFAKPLANVDRQINQRYHRDNHINQLQLNVIRKSKTAKVQKPAPGAICAFVCEKPMPSSITTFEIAPIKVKMVMLPNGS